MTGAGVVMTGTRCRYEKAYSFWMARWRYDSPT
jgi:hypothetical protein